MILHLSGDVNYEMFNSLVKAFNELKGKDKLHIYFTTQGGMTDVAEAIIDFVNRNSNRIHITFYGDIFSAGMYIFLSTLCERCLLKDTRGMFHFSWIELIITEGGKPTDDYDMFLMKEMKRNKPRTLELLKTTGLNDKEIAYIKKGKDVYFTHERLNEILDGKQ